MMFVVINLFSTSVDVVIFGYDITLIFQISYHTDPNVDQFTRPSLNQDFVVEYIPKSWEEYLKEIPPTDPSVAQSTHPSFDQDFDIEYTQEWFEEYLKENLSRDVKE